MTTGIVVMIGAGILLIISAIENASIIATFIAVWTGQPIASLAGQARTGSSTSSSNKPTAAQDTGQIPKGFIPK